MKTTFTTIAALALSTTTAFAGGLAGPIAETATPAAYSGPTLYATCDNAPTRNGSATAFKIVNMPNGAGHMYFLLDGVQDYVTTDRVGGVMPAGMSPKDGQDVVNYMDSIGYPDVVLVTRPDRDERTEQTEVETVVARGTSDGSAPSGDNLTSMGSAVSDGATILRIRSTIAQNVSIRRAGSDIALTRPFEAGDTLIAVDGPGTYIATFSGTGKSKTKATGPQDFNDVSTETVDVVVRTSTDGEWCK